MSNAIRQQTFLPQFLMNQNISLFSPALIYARPNSHFRGKKGETREIHVEIQINEKAEIKRIFCGEGN